MRRILVLQVSGTKVDLFGALMMGHLQTLKILDCRERKTMHSQHTMRDKQSDTQRRCLISWRIPVPNFPHVFHGITLNPSNISRFASVPYNQAISPSIILKYFRAKKKCFWTLSSSLVTQELLKSGIHPPTIPYPTAGMVSVLTPHQSPQATPDSLSKTTLHTL